MASDQVYDVHLLYFTRDYKYFSHALMLIDPTKFKKGIGILYRLKGPMSLGMDLEIIERYDLNQSGCFKAEGKKFTMPQSCRERFELIVRQTERPVHPLALIFTDPGPPPRDDKNWVDDILHDARIQLFDALLYTIR